ncbi:MAG: Ig-like domain-containing protein [Candidatus Aminicenantes bacterium]|nr:Ig-like domain-containing protein [Candidatus Aminicenantes bacterium]
MKKKVILTILVTVLLFPGFICGVIPASERAALIAFYNSTNGDSWNHNSGWKTPPLHTDGFAMPGTEGNWFGVTLSGNYVRNLILAENKLSDRIPSELAWLDDLWYLDLNNNKLSGEIPYLNPLPQFVLVDIGYNCLYSTDSEIRAWIDSHDPDWEAHQNQCGAVNIPTVSTNSISSITSKSAICGGNVTSNGGAPVTSRGVCWSTSLTPTIADSKTTDGTGTGSFTSNITGLNPDTTYYVRAYATNSRGTAYGSNMSFKTNPPEIPTIGLNHRALNFGASISGPVTPPQTVLVSNTGLGDLNWNASSNATWLSVTPSSGSGDSALSVSVDPSGLAVGNYTGAIIITDPNASNSPQTITVILNVYEQGQTSAPIGEFATPPDGSSVCNSIPVTGWALDDIGVANVKIYNGDAYIGDALLVEGARPDIETAYPFYPNNYKAGWGYMLLTNCLPDGGNGTYTLTAIAIDMEGNEVTLGSKTIAIDNAHAVKPFGAIDTPTQGGTATGTKFINNGWALTPQPNTIPFDGSTINVVIDGVVKGHPIYNIYRWDIAWFFPGYANSNTAAGYYYLDTTKLSNGVHTIAWIVSDTEGNSDGIGSRYFSIQNSGAGDQGAGEKGRAEARKSGRAEKDESRRGAPPCAPVFDTYSPVLDSYSPTFDELISVEIQELARVEINLSDEGVFEGYSVVGDQLRELPIGSTLDKENGIFYWQSGPGFVGEYRLLFIGRDNNGQQTRKNIVVNIKPKQ